MKLGEGLVCRSCLFWELVEERLLDGLGRGAGELRGECRRKPPVLNPRVGVFRWPETQGSQWCGEYELRQDIQEKHEREQLGKLTDAIKQAIFEATGDKPEAEDKLQ